MTTVDTHRWTSPADVLRVATAALEAKGVKEAAEVADVLVETSLLGPPLKKLLGFDSCVVPGVSVANWTKSRPFKGS